MNSDDEGYSNFKPVYLLSREKRYDEALALLIGADGKINNGFDDDLNHAWYCAGDLYYRQEDFPRAIQCFIKSIQDRPDDFQAWFALGNAFSDNGNHREAASCFFCLQIMNPGHENAQYNYAGALMDMGDFANAIIALQSIKNKTKAARKNLKLSKEKLKSTTRAFSMD